MEPIKPYFPAWAVGWSDVIWPTLQVAAIVAVAWVLQALIRRLLTRVGQRYQLPANVVAPTRNLARWVIYGVAVVAFCAAWSVLSNLFCALLIFTTRPFREGDVVEVIDSGDKPGIKGRVVDIRLIYTVMQDQDAAHPGALLQVPNTLFFQKSLRRWRAGADLPTPGDG